MEDRQEYISRQQKVLAAKAAFGTVREDRQASVRGSYPWMGNGSEGESLAEEEKTLHEEWRRRRCFALLRFMSAAVLTIVLLVAFSQGFSYHGFNQEFVQEKLDDERVWNQLEQKVQQVYLNWARTEDK